MADERRPVDERRNVESLSGPEEHDKVMIDLYNEGLSYREIQAKHPEWTHNFIELRLKLMGAMGEVTLRKSGGNTHSHRKQATPKRGPKGRFEKE